MARISIQQELDQLNDPVTITMDRRFAIEELAALRLDGNRPHVYHAYEMALNPKYKADYEESLKD